MNTNLLIITNKVKEIKFIERFSSINKYTIKKEKDMDVTQMIGNAQVKNSLIIINHPFTFESDIDLLNTFIKESEKSNKNCIYYSARPNSKLDVNDFEILLIKNYSLLKKKNTTVNQKIIKPRFTLLRKIIPEALKKPIRRIIYNPKIAELKKMNLVLKTFIMKFFNNPGLNEASISKLNLNEISASSSNLNNKNSIELVNDIVFGAVDKIPSSLKSLDEELENWVAPIKMLKKDIIERMDDFFPYPRGFHVSIINKCNLKCVMCPYHSPVYKEAHKSNFFDSYTAMTMDVFKKIADYAALHKTTIQLGQLEEALMHKKVFEFIKYAKDVGVPHVHLTTNGIMLTKKMAEKLINTNIDSVMFSVDSTDPKTYKEIRGSDLNLLEKNIKYFTNQIKNKKITTWVSFIMQEQSKGQKDDFIDKWKNTGINNITFYALTDHNVQTGSPYRPNGDIYENDEERYPCSSPWIQSIVYPNGDVSLCCKTLIETGWNGTVSVGSLNFMNFDEIWESSRYKKVRNELLNNEFDQFPVCADCFIWSSSDSRQEQTEEYVRNYNETMETFTFNR